MLRLGNDLLAQIRVASQLSQSPSAFVGNILRYSRWIEARSRATNLGGYLIVFADVTDAKESEAKLHELNPRLHALANTDQLTSLPNRRAFDQHLDAAVFDATMTDSDVALLMIDVDHFKLYNDRYGHVAGDEALQKVACCIDTIVSTLPSAKVSRYGGEEFAAVIPYVSTEQARGIGQLLCASVRGLAVPHEAAQAGHITISVGITTMLSVGIAGGDELIQSADTALYQAKGMGRDRVQIHNENRRNQPLHFSISSS